jgi:hypothetical protein
VVLVDGFLDSMASWLIVCGFIDLDDESRGRPRLRPGVVRDQTVGKGQVDYRIPGCKVTWKFVSSLFVKCNMSKIGEIRTNSLSAQCANLPRPCISPIFHGPKNTILPLHPRRDRQWKMRERGTYARHGSATK